MLAYVILIGVPIIYAMSRPIAQTIEKYRKKQKKILMLFFVLYFAILALRHRSIGVDMSGSYFYYFSLYGNADWKYFANIAIDSEPAFPVLCKAVYTITNNEQVFTAVLAMLILFPVAYLYVKESENALMTIALFVITPLFHMFFSTIRQSIAMALMVPLYYFTKQKNLIPYFLIIGVAFLFHNSALVMLPFYWIYHVRVNKNWLLVIAPMLILSYVFNERLFIFSLRFLGDRYVERYGEIVSTGAYAMLLLYMIFAVYSFMIPDTKLLDQDTIGLRNLLLFSVVLQSFAPLNNVAMRLNCYYILFHPLVIPRIANRATGRNKQIAFVSRAVICNFFFVYFIYNGYAGSDTLEIFPYLPFWGNPT